jgi:hypothetical protein
MKRFVRSVFFAVAAVVLVPSLSLATTFLDPSTLHIGTGAGTSCAVGCGGDPNVVPTNKLDIYQNAGGAGGLNNPVLLILAVANDTTNLFGSNPISSATYYNPYPGGASDPASSFNGATAGTFGLKSAVSGSFFGYMTASSPDVYTFLTLQQPTNNSNSFVNMAGADKADEGVTATSFGIYVFALVNNNPLGANGLINITFGTALPTGSYAFAFGEDTTNSKIYDTPFTESGLTGGNVTTLSAVPEPASLILLGSGLLIVGRNFRKNRQMQKSRELKSAQTRTSASLEGGLTTGTIS